MRTRILLNLVLMAGIFSTDAYTADFYVSPDGSDRASGTEGAPFATLARARDAVRVLSREQPDRDIRVLLRGGVHRISDTVLFSLEDSAGDSGRTITYAAYPGERPVLTGSAPVTGWRRLEGEVPGLAESVRAHVWVADVAEILQARSQRVMPSGAGLPVDAARSRPFRVVFRDGAMLPRARGTGFNPTAPTPNRRGPDQEILRFPSGAVQAWPDLAQAELRIIPCSFWVMNLLPFGDVDTEANTARMAAPGTYSLGRNGMRDRPSCWVENTLAVLDEPGEWVLDADAGRLYLRSWDDQEPRGIKAPLLTELIRVEGRIDYSGPADEPVRGIVFRGLTFTGGDSLPWHGNTGWGLQHDWEMFDRPTALLRFRGAERCAVTDCTFVNSGHTGIRLDLHCQAIRVVGNRLHALGGVGILLAGYGPGTKDVNRRNVVSNNYVHDIGTQFWGSPAVFAWQSGENSIDHNWIHHTPYTAIVVSGRVSWDRNGIGECSRTCRFAEIEGVLGKDFARPDWKTREQFLHARKNSVHRNDIHNVMEVTGDGNAIYVSGCGGGNVVSENYCHDNFGRYMNAVIRCDDDQHGTIIRRNICTRSQGHGEGFINKGANQVLENIFADLRPTNHHRGYLVLVRYPQHGAVIERNVFYSCLQGQTAVSETRPPPGSMRIRPALLADADVSRNVYHCTADPDWGPTHLAEHQKGDTERNSIAADPLFTDPSRDNFQFRPGSPALELGIAQPVRIEQTGLEEPYRERWGGRRLWTDVSPKHAVLYRAVAVTLSCSDPDAAIRYTLDGSVPDEHSPRYDAPITIREACTVRARSFSDEGVDLVGAQAVFDAPPQPVSIDFESVSSGAQAPLFVTQEENQTFTARVTDETAASGRHALKFVDGPGQKQPFNPHVYLRTAFTKGTLRTRFDMLISETSEFYCQWREYPRGRHFVSGPTLRIEAGGRVVHNDSELVTLPVGRWVHAELEATLGEEADGTFTLRITIPGRETPAVFEDLPCSDDLTSLQWLGFVSFAEGPAATFIDTVEIIPIYD